MKYFKLFWLLVRIVPLFGIRKIQLKFNIGKGLLEMNENILSKLLKEVYEL